jgi:hypothetical protein
MSKVTKNLIKLLIIGTLLTAPLARANNECQVHALDKGQPADCQGYLFPVKIEEWARTDREIRIRTFKNINLQLTTKMEIVANQRQQINNLNTINQELASEVERRKKQNMYWAIGGTLGGILLTSLAISAANR